MAKLTDPDLHDRADWYFQEARRLLGPGNHSHNLLEWTTYATLLAVCDIKRMLDGQQPS